ncbi:MAG TPA: serine hydrolase [Candidatus Dormibacteraeota bacterium]|nr:serine hydrolase [Candidatus Dormibacteraeota bacterium]
MSVVVKGGVTVALLGALFLLAGFWVGFSLSRTGAGPQAAQGSDVVAPDQTAGAKSGGQPAKRHPSFAGLQQTVQGLLDDAGASGGISLIELGTRGPQSWSYQGDQEFAAASTYKLPLLMQEAQNVASGRWHGTDLLCYQDGDWEDGYYGDYEDGVCLSRAQLGHRVGQQSDNTAAHILIRYDGGSSSLNSYARAHGTQHSAFFDPNTTTASDLARLWANEATGRAGGRQAQQYLYPMLTHTAYEQGIPAGVPSKTTVVHKIGILGGVVNDAALILGGPAGAYVLAICTEVTSGDASWKLQADLSRAVWQFEATR